VAFSPDGKLLATASADNTARLSFWRPEDMIAVACSRLNRNLTREEWKQYLGDESYHKTCANLPLDPSYLDEGKRLAKEGKLQDAIVAFRGLQKLELSLNPEAEARQFSALGLVEKGEKLAREGQVQEAITAFHDARSLDPSLTLDPESDARKLAAPGLVEKGKALVKQEGKIQEALAAYAQAQQFDPTLKISSKHWNNLCWNGSLSGNAAAVMNACQQAVKLDPENREIRDSRGLARALTGDTKGAIEDFSVFVKKLKKEKKSETNELRIKQRTQWIAALKAGKNPFDAGTLNAIRDQ